MNIIEKENGVLIAFGTINTKLRILFFFEAIVSTSFIAMGAIWGISALSQELYGLFIFCIGLIVLGCVLIWRYLTRVFRREKMFVTKDTITLINTSFSGKQQHTYDISAISFLNYMGRGKKTDHPLKGQSFDYLGFETQELVIGEVNTEGNISFSYGGKIVHFGRDVYSWDAEKINEQLVKITNGTLSIGNITIEDGDDNASGSNSNFN